MEAAEIAQALAGLSGLRVTVLDDCVCVYLPAIDDSVQLLAGQVQRFTSMFAPNGDPALEFVIGDEHEVWPLIIVADGVAFAPEDPVAVLDSPIPFQITNAPHLVAYSEMERDAEEIALASESSDEIDLYLAAGSYLLLRCFIAGAVRLGLRPIHTVAWWHRGWEALAGDVPLPPFRFDPVWDELTRDAAHVTLAPSTAPDDANDVAAIAALTVADFQLLEPRLTVVQLDDEFVSSWKLWIPITPMSLADTLMAGLGGAEADLALYPDGGGSIDLTLQADGETRAILQLRFTFRDHEMAIDEIRIAQSATGRGLFQRMIFNTERLASLLGLGSLTVLATDIGSYALATVGVYPRDTALFRKIHPAANRPLSPDATGAQASDEAEPSPRDLPPPG
jgi:hypothetical protein